MRQHLTKNQIRLYKKLDTPAKVQDFLDTLKINFEEKSVTSTVFGLKKRKAVYKDGIGCVLIPEGENANIAFKPNRKISQIRIASLKPESLC